MRYPVLFALALLPAATNAATVEISGDRQWRTLESDEFFETDDWPALRERVLAAWKGSRIEEVPFSSLPPFAEGIEEATYRSVTDGFELLHLATGPENEDILRDLAFLYPDIGPEDVEAFGDGVIVEAVAVAPAMHDISVFFLARLDAPVAPDAVEPSFADRLIQALPDATVIVENDDPTGKTVMLSTTSKANTVIARARTLASADGLDIDERDETPGSVLIGGRDGKAVSIVVLDNGDEGSTVMIVDIKP